MDEVLCAMKAIDRRFGIQAAEWWVRPATGRLHVLFRNRAFWHEAYVELGNVDVVATLLSNGSVLDKLERSAGMNLSWIHYTGE